MTLRETGGSRVGRGSLLAGKYRLEMLLGEGGMGYVWSAYNRELELPVAIKLLRAGRTNRRLAERLRREARAAARLVHPSIVRVFDVALTDEGDPFIVMELLTGETLADTLARGPLSGVRAVQLLLPIADALAHAHARGVVHRDLKPDNVFLATDGEQLQPKLLDFGIAKLGHGLGTSSKLTEDGVVLGSPHYMSPEQVSGEDVDERTDIWSFCVVLYRALAGAAPFTGADKRAVMDAILRDDPAPLPTSPRVDPELGHILRWGLSKDPSERPASIRELGSALGRWLFEQGGTEDASGTPLSGKWLVAAPPTVPCGPPPAPRPDTGPHHQASLPRHGRRRELAAAAGLLILGGSLAWTDSARTSVKEPAAVVAAPRALVPSPPPAQPEVSAPPAVVAAPAPEPPPAPRRPRAVRKPAPQLPF